MQSKACSSSRLKHVGEAREQIGIMRHDGVDVTFRELLLKYKDETVILHRGDTLVLTLSDIPTAGYCWTVEKFDSEVIELVRTDDSSAATSIGGGRLRKFAFEAKGPGVTVVELKLSRQWEVNQPASKRFRVTVNVT